jgi:hypothetical protein
VADQVSHRVRRAVHRRRASEPYLNIDTEADHALGMITPEERAYLQWYASSEYAGRGVIADLGCWMGSSTVNLALGLARNHAVADKSKRIHAFDLFLWEDWMEPTAVGTPHAGRFRPGDSFIEAYREQTAAWEELIETHPGDLSTLGWDPSTRIEFAFNDASKSWALTGAILRDFHPAFLPGVTLVVEQDFAHFYTPWVHLARLRMKPFFAPLIHIRFSASAVFRCTQTVPDDVLHAPFGPDAFSEDEIEEAFRDSYALVSPEMRANVAAARVMLYVHAGDLERARHELREAEAAGIRGRDLIRVKRHYLPR